MAGKPLPLESRYDIDPETGCWNWKRGLSRGYPTTIQRMTRGVLTAVIAYRFFYEQAHGPIQPGLDLDHLCRNRRCVNPGHLEPVTRAENIRRSRVTKLSKSQVEAIRSLKHSGLTQAEIARQFGVGQTIVSRIMSGQRWSA